MALKHLLGGNVRAARTARGWSQAALAERAGLSANAVGRLERGETAVRFRTVERIADALGVEPSALFATEPPLAPQPDRARRLERLTAILARMTDAELDRAARVIRAVEG